MIEKGIEEQAALYVLDLLTGEELSDFEDRLKGSPDLKHLVRELRNGVFAGAKKSTGPLRMDLLEGIHARLGIDSDRIPAPQEEKQSSLPWSYIWAIAAMVFLGLNLMLLTILGNRDSASSRERLAQSGSIPSDESGNSSAQSLSAEDTLTLQAQIERLRNALSSKEYDLRSREEILASLESENEEIRTYNAGWQREYTRLAAKFLPFFESNDGMSRFTVIEMVDAESYAQQSPRRGFAELAGSFLSGEGNIAGVGDIAFVGPVAAGAGLSTSTAEPGVAGLTPSVRGAEGSAVPGIIPDAGTEDFVDVNSDMEIVTSPAILDSGDPAGFTVWRDDEQKGFLDLYNLPQAGDGEAAYLWVRSSELEPYLPVGFLPELENGTGSLFYEVDEANFTPSEILVTSERENEPANSPSGDILLRGP